LILGNAEISHDNKDNHCHIITCTSSPMSARKMSCKTMVVVDVLSHWPVCPRDSNQKHATGITFGQNKHRPY